MYTKDDVISASLQYFNNDALAASVFTDKYALQHPKGVFHELTPDDMHHRLAREFARIECKFNSNLTYETLEHQLYGCFKNFQYIIPQGSPMYGIGNDFTLSSLSNCVVVSNPEDDISSIVNHGKDLANLFKRRCGVGIDISNLRPDGTLVSNAAGTTSGAWSFADFYSYVCRMIGQNGRRGALMISMSVEHPDIASFIQMKQDKTKVTGANVSVRITDKFMNAVENDETYLQHWPVDSTEPSIVKEVRARDIWDLIVKAATDSAEPGILMWDNCTYMLPAERYPGFKSVTTNPCVTGDTKILTSKGWIEIKNLTTDNHTITIDSRFGKDTQSVIQPAFITGEKPVFKLITREGFEIKLTADHQVMTSKGWIKAQHLQTNDQIFITNTTGGFGEHHNPKAGLLAGWFAGDGCIVNNNSAKFYFYHQDQELLPLITNALETLCTKIPKIHFNTKQNCSYFQSTELAQILNFENKRTQIPEWLWATTKETQKLFLSALFTADGQIGGNQNKSYYVRLTSIDLKLLQDVQTMLLNFGIYSKIYQNTGYRNLPDGNGGLDSYYCEAVHDLHISKNNLIKFYNEINFLRQDKITALATAIKTVSKRGFYKEKYLATFKELIPLGIETVYDLTEPTTHSFVANGLVVHNCGEVILSPFDSCRLMVINLANMVRNPYTSNAYFDFETFSEYVRVATWLSDDLVELELEKLNAIYNKVDTEDEKILWSKLIKAATEGRRTGLGTVGLANVFSKLQLVYGSPESIQIANDIFETLANINYETSALLAQERGAFPIYDSELEKDHPFINQLNNETRKLINLHGRRNISALTQAPTGSVAIVAQVNSGLEVRPIRPESH